LPNITDTTAVWRDIGIDAESSEANEKIRQFLKLFSITQNLPGFVAKCKACNH
jgi:hypothetical protein